MKPIPVYVAVVVVVSVVHADAVASVADAVVSAAEVAVAAEAAAAEAEVAHAEADVAADVVADVAVK
ncbi:hypothetical protein [Paenibacillus elgii]|uniref:hypothetical protein n=1 Tax=Paenibacillus elgii TaxID=189691 RepID=UPI000248C089|nr:hypothetical protein [Paenibacillus elgii]